MFHSFMAHASVSAMNTEETTATNHLPATEEAGPDVWM